MLEYRTNERKFKPGCSPKRTLYQKKIKNLEWI
jgi:hypothetical protein